MAIIKSNDIFANSEQLNELKSCIKDGINNGMDEIQRRQTIIDFINRELLNIISKNQDKFDLDDNKEVYLYTLAYNDGAINLAETIIKKLEDSLEAADGEM